MEGTARENMSINKQKKEKIPAVNIRVEQEDRKEEGTKERVFTFYSETKLELLYLTFQLLRQYYCVLKVKVEDSF